MESQQKKGLSPIAWVGIGCGGIVVIAGVVIAAAVFWGFGKAKEFASDPAAAAELIISMHPDLDHVSTDRDAGTMTIRNKSNGEEVTLNFDDIQQGRFSIQGGDGEDVFSVDSSNDGNDGGVTIRSSSDGEINIGGNATMADVPEWVPVYPNTLKSTMATNRKSPAGKATGTLAFEVSDDVTTITEYYKSALGDAGYSVDEQNISAGGAVSQTVLTANHAGDGHTITIIAGEANGRRTLMINYEEK